MVILRSALERDNQESEETADHISTPAIKIIDDLDRIIRGTILPNRHSVHTFTSLDAKLYINNRKWLVATAPESSSSDRKVFPRNKKQSSKDKKSFLGKSNQSSKKRKLICNYYTGKPFYEDYMDYIFWDNNLEKNLIFVEGEVGIGKSTFIDYYFRCYCPNNSTNKKNFKHKVFLKVDLKGIHDKQSLYREMQESFVTSLKNYIGNNKNKIFDQIEDTVYSIDEEKIGLWWKKLYQYYEKLISDKVLSSSPYLVIILDNIDQCSRELQTTLVREAEILIRKSGVWSVIIPVWPSTLSYLRDDDHMRFRPSRYYHLRLGRVQRDKLYRSRVKLLKKEIINKTRSLRLELEDKADLNDIKYYLSNSFYSLNKKHLRNLELISGGNIRDLLWYLFNIYTGITYLNHYNKKNSGSQNTIISSYQFYDSLLLGVNQYYHQDNSKIVNVFNISNNKCENNLLIGYHALLLLTRSQKELKLSVVTNELKSLGYEIHDIEYTLEKLYKLHFYDHLFLNQDRVKINTLKVRGYIDLISEPAYIDNISQETPLPESYLSYIKLSNGYEESHFQKRVESTMNFLSYLRQREEIFSTKMKINSHYNAKYAWLLLGNPYVKRLNYLKRTRKINPSSNWWNEIMSKSIVKGIENDFKTKIFYPTK